MTKEDAEKLSVALMQILAKLNETASFVQDKDSKADWDVYRRAVAGATAAVSLDLTGPLWERFPDLKPMQVGGSYAVDPSVFQPSFYNPESGA